MESLATRDLPYGSDRTSKKMMAFVKNTIFNTTADVSFLKLRPLVSASK